MAEAIQLRWDERKEFIAEEMDKLRNLQAERREGEIEARLRVKERAARQQAAEREKEREARLQAEERSARIQAEENERQARLKIEELKAQIEIEKIPTQAGVKTEGGAVEGTTSIYADQVKPKLPRLPAFLDEKNDLDSWLLHFERFANTSRWLKEN